MQPNQQVTPQTPRQYFSRLMDWLLSLYFCPVNKTVFQHHNLIFEIGRDTVVPANLLQVDISLAFLLRPGGSNTSEILS